MGNACNLQEKYKQQEITKSLIPSYPNEHIIDTSPNDRDFNQFSEVNNSKIIKLSNLNIIASKGILKSIIRNETLKQQRQKIGKQLATQEQNIFRQQEKQNNTYHHSQMIQIDSSLLMLPKKSKKQYKRMSISVSDFIKIRQQSIQTYYHLNEKIGQGTFGCVYKGTCLLSGQPRAIKILKKEYIEKQLSKQMMAQMNLLKKMDHPNIIKLYQLFYWKGQYYVVTQLCQGGQLRQIIDKQIICEQTVLAQIMKQLICAVSYIHHQKIAHRDLKVQNIIFSRKVDLRNLRKSSLDIRIIDFGLASKVKGYLENIGTYCGTLPYMSPQTLNEFLSQRCDIWSCGIIFHLLLFHRFPFQARKKQALKKEIMNFRLDFKDPKWRSVSVQAQDLIRLMLQTKPHLRMSAENLLLHKWFKIHNKNTSSRDSIKKNKETFDVLCCHQAGSNFQNLINCYITFKNITQKQRQRLAQAFRIVDKNNSGMIDVSELSEMYFQVTGERNGEKIRKIIGSVDKNNSGLIDFSEFLMVMYTREKKLLDKQIEEAFQYLDADKTGFIEVQQLKNLLKECDQEEIIQLFNCMDTNRDQKVSKEELISYMKSW